MRILLDAMLGGLRSYLRICGHDAAYALDRGIEDDDELLAWATDENRTLVTRDRGLAARAGSAIVVEDREVPGQLRELRSAGVDLELADPPERCGRCNGHIHRATPTDPPEYVPDEASELWQCEDCDQFFWKGSHWADVRATLSEI
jgi:uncharacterized protein with PIN domain